MSWKRAHIWNLALAALLLLACQFPGSAPGLPAPAEFSGTVGSATSIGLRWRKVEGASGYELERKVGGGGFSPLIPFYAESLVLGHQWNRVCRLRVSGSWARTRHRSATTSIISSRSPKYRLATASFTKGHTRSTGWSSGE
jgi:hypothetical protein